MVKWMFWCSGLVFGCCSLFCCWCECLIIRICWFLLIWRWCWCLWWWIRVICCCRLRCMNIWVVICIWNRSVVIILVRFVWRNGSCELSVMMVLVGCVVLMWGGDLCWWGILSMIRMWLIIGNLWWLRLSGLLWIMCCFLGMKLIIYIVFIL